MAEQRKKLRLGELLVQQGLITQDQLRIALTEQKAQNIPIGRLLVRLVLGMLLPFFWFSSLVTTCNPVLRVQNEIEENETGGK